MATSPLQPGELLVASNQTNKLTLFKVSNSGNTVLSTLPKVHNNRITYIEFHPKSRFCITVSEDCVIVWDTLHLEVLKKLTNPQNNKKSCRFTHASFNQHEIISCTEDSIHIWDLRTFELKKSLELPQNASAKKLDFLCCAISPDQNHLVTAGSNHPYMSLWSFFDSKLIRVFALPYGSNGVSKISISPNSEECIILTREGKLLSIRLNDFSINFEIFADTSHFLNFSLTDDWKILEAHGDNGIIYIYDYQILKEHQDKLISIESYACSAHEDPSLSNVRKYLSSVDPNIPLVNRRDFDKEINKNGQDLLTKSSNQKNVRFNNYVQDENRPSSRFESKSNSRLEKSNNEQVDSQTIDLQYPETRKTAFKKTIPNKSINTSKWTTNIYYISDKLKREDVERKEVTFPKNRDGQVKEIALNYEKLRHLLLTHGEYPSKYRTMVWRFLLSLPENGDVFTHFLMKGPHDTTKDLHKKYPISDGRLYRRLEKSLSALMHYAPVFACSNDIPELIFPFIKLFESDLLSIFETVVTFYLNWGKEWLKSAPNPPNAALDMVQRILEEFDPILFDFFKESRITSETYAWTLLKSLFSQVFSKDSWLILFDHVLSMPILFLYYFTVAYLIHFRKTIMSLKKEEDFKFFFENENPCNIRKIIEKTYDLMQRTELRFPNYEFFEKLPLSYYPIISEYPKQVVKKQFNNREEILRQEKNIRSRKQRFIEDEKYRLKPEETADFVLQRKKELEEFEKQQKIQQDQLKKQSQEEYLRKQRENVNNIIKQSSNLIQSDQAHFKRMENEISTLRSQNEEILNKLYSSELQKGDSLQFDLQRQKSLIQKAVESNQDYSQVARTLESLRDQIDSALTELSKASPTSDIQKQQQIIEFEKQNLDNKEDIPLQSIHEIEIRPELQRIDSDYIQESDIQRDSNSDKNFNLKKQAKIEEIAIQKYKMKGKSSSSSNMDIKSESSIDAKRKIARPEDPVGRQLDSGVVSPPPKPLRSPPKQDASLKIKSQKKKSTKKLQKRRKKVVIPNARSTSPYGTTSKELSTVSGSVSQLTSEPASRPISRSESRSSSRLGSKIASRATTTQSGSKASSIKKQEIHPQKKKAISFEQNRYIREKFLDFMNSRGSITRETPSKSESSLTEYPWMEEISDSISISDSYSLGDVSTDSDSIIQSLKEKHPLARIDHGKKQDASDEFTFIEDDDMITTLPSETLGDFTVPSVLRSEDTSGKTKTSSSSSITTSSLSSSTNKSTSTNQSSLSTHDSSSSSFLFIPTYSRGISKTTISKSDSSKLNSSNLEESKLDTTQSESIHDKSSSKLSSQSTSKLSKSVEDDFESSPLLEQSALSNSRSHSTSTSKVISSSYSTSDIGSQADIFTETPSNSRIDESTSNLEDSKINFGETTRFNELRSLQLSTESKTSKLPLTEMTASSVPSSFIIGSDLDSYQQSTFTSGYISSTSTNSDYENDKDKNKIQEETIDESTTQLKNEYLSAMRKEEYGETRRSLETRETNSNSELKLQKEIYFETIPVGRTSGTLLEEFEENEEEVEKYEEIEEKESINSVSSTSEVTSQPALSDFSQSISSVTDPTIISQPLSVPSISNTTTRTRSQKSYIEQLDSESERKSEESNLALSHPSMPHVYAFIKPYPINKEGDQRISPTQRPIQKKLEEYLNSTNTEQKSRNPPIIQRINSESNDNKVNTENNPIVKGSKESISNQDEKALQNSGKITNERPQPAFSNETNEENDELDLSYVDELLKDISDDDEDVSININDYISDDDEHIEADQDAYVSVTTSDVMNASTSS